MRTATSNRDTFVIQVSVKGPEISVALPCCACKGSGSMFVSSGLPTLEISSALVALLLLLRLVLLELRRLLLALPKEEMEMEDTPEGSSSLATTDDSFLGFSVGLVWDWPRFCLPASLFLLACLPLHRFLGERSAR